MSRPLENNHGHGLTDRRAGYPHSTRDWTEREFEPGRPVVRHRPCGYTHVRGAGDAMSSEAFPEDLTAPRGFSIEVENHGETVVLDVKGEVDLVTAPRLEESITEVLARQPGMLVVDLTGVDFLASIGMSILVGCHERAGDSTRFRLVASGASTFRPMELTGLVDTIPTYPTRDRALQDE